VPDRHVAKVGQGLAGRGCRASRFGNQGVIAENDPAEQEKSVEWNSLPCNLIVFHTAIDMMEVIRQLGCRGVAGDR
jgi:hypothetical protein